jgi:RND family efflux transporter MFP subunit
MRRWSLALVLSLATACQRAALPDTTDQALLVGRENLVVAAQETLQVGPALSGTLEAERSATVRAELGGALIAVEVEPGQPVARGAVLGRIDASGIRDAYESARTAVTTAELNVELARRNVDRARALANAGAIAAREREQSEWNLSTAETQLADARARAVSAEKQLAKTTLVAPFAGVVSERQANLGDIVQVGNPLFTVVDPRSLKLEGSVPAEALGQLRLGMPVIFTVAGAGSRPLRGRLTRINPVADPATRQIRITVAIANAESRLAAGLFADGRVATAERYSVVLPADAVDRAGLRPTVVLIKAGQVARNEVELGLIDEGSARLEILQGVSPGDTVLVGSARGLPVGAAVRIGSPAERTVSAAAPAGKE